LSQAPGLAVTFGWASKQYGVAQCIGRNSCVTEETLVSCTGQRWNGFEQTVMAFTGQSV